MIQLNDLETVTQKTIMPGVVDQRKS